MITCDRNQPAHYKDEATGTFYPSVSQVLDVLYPDRFRYVDPHILGVAQDRGVRRHLLFGVLALWKAKLAPEPTIDPRDREVAAGLLRWIYEHDVHPLRVEEPAINVKDGYGGCPDGQFLYGPKRLVLLPDLKTGVQDEAHRIQVQAYLRLPGYLNSQCLMDVYVDEQGTVREQVVNLSSIDWCWFLNGLGVVRGRLARGVAT